MVIHFFMMMKSMPRIFWKSSVALNPTISSPSFSSISINFFFPYLPTSAMTSFSASRNCKRWQLFFECSTRTDLIDFFRRGKQSHLSAHSCPLEEIRYRHLAWFWSSKCCPHSCSTLFSWVRGSKMPRHPFPTSHSQKARWTSLTCIGCCQNMFHFRPRLSTGRSHPPPHHPHPHPLP